MSRGLAWALILLSLLAALPILAGRVSVEQPNRSVELVLDLDEARVLSRTLGVEVEDLLAGLAEAGLTSLAVKEATVQTLGEAGRVGLVRGGDLERAVRTGQWRHPLLAQLVAAGRLDETYSYLVMADGTTADWLEGSLRQRLPGLVVRHGGDGLYLLGVPGGPERVEKLELGMVPDDLALARQAGLALVPRFANYPDITAEAIDAAFRSARSAGRVTSVIFTGYQVLGYPGELAATADNLRDVVLGLVETPVQRAFIRQDGHEELAAGTGYRVARVYSISRREIDKHLDPPKAIEMWVRSVKERNIRILYLRPFLRPPAGFEGVDLGDLNRGYIRDLTGELRLAGFTPGPAEPFGPRRVAPWASALASLGAVGGLLLLIREFVDPGPRLGPALVLLGAAAVAAAFALRADLAVAPAALAAALVFPSLGGAILVRRWARRAERPGREPAVRPALLDLAIVTLWSLLGSLLVAAIMGDIRYLLEFEYFRGVKLSALGPPVVTVLAYFRHFPPVERAGAGGLRELWHSVRAHLEARMTWLHLAAFALAAIAIFLYLGRTGHEAGIPVAAWEIHLRSWLERTLYARPRIKEFLIGHPALMLGTLAALRGYRLLLLPAAVVAAVGQASLVNSFEHLRTPLLLSLLRTGNGLVLGALLGVVLLAAADICLCGLERLGLTGRGAR